MREKLINTLIKMGYPEEFGAALALQLRTDKAISRMIGYLHSAKPCSAEGIADEMLAICEDRDRWVQKKQSEYYNSKYNDILNHGL